MRRLAMLVSFALLLTLSASAALAQDYPSKPIKLIVSSPPGSLLDVIARLLAHDLGLRLGQSIIIDNRPGAMTQLAADAASRAAPDGLTLMVGTNEMTMLPYLKKSYRFDPVGDFTPIALAVSSWTVYATNPKLPVKSLSELIAYAKQHPGAIRYGSGGVGGALHIAVEMLATAAGIDLTHVAYRGGAQAAADAVAGQIDMVSMGLGSTRVAENGQLRLLAQAGPSRHPMLPAVPTTGELGFPDVQMNTWFGLVGPPGLPAEIVTRLSREVEAVVAQPEFRDKLVAIGCETAFKPAPAFTAFLTKETKKWARTLPTLKISVLD